MKEKEKKKARARLGQLKQELEALPKTGNEARKATIKGEIFCILCDLPQYACDSDWVDIIGDKFLFDPSEDSSSGLKEEKEKARARLSQLKQELEALPKTGNEARKATIKSEIFCIFCDLCPQFDEADIGDRFLFDLSEDSLSGLEEEKARLDKLGQEWGALPETGEEARRLSLQNTIFCAVYDLYQAENIHDSTWANAINSVFLNDWPHFNPAKGSLSKFISARVRYRKIDIEKADIFGREVKQTDLVTNKVKKVKEPFISLDDDRTSEIVDKGSRQSPEDLILFNERAWEILSLILNLSKHLKGKANNPTRINYFRLFFTGGLVKFLQFNDSPEIYFQHERDVFRAMKQSFLDFLLTKPCHTLLDIQQTKLKYHGQLVEGQSMIKEPPQPLPADVYVAYLKQVENYQSSDESISEMRKAYWEFLVEAGLPAPSRKKHTTKTAKKSSKL